MYVPSQAAPNTVSFERSTNAFAWLCVPENQPFQEEVLEAIL